jgi:hypothetical protein
MRVAINDSPAQEVEKEANFGTGAVHVLVMRVSGPSLHQKVRMLTAFSSLVHGNELGTCICLSV